MCRRFRLSECRRETARIDTGEVTRLQYRFACVRFVTQYWNVIESRANAF